MPTQEFSRRGLLGAGALGIVTAVLAVSSRPSRAATGFEITRTPAE